MFSFLVSACRLDVYFQDEVVGTVIVENSVVLIVKSNVVTCADDPVVLETSILTLCLPPTNAVGGGTTTMSSLTIAVDETSASSINIFAVDLSIVESACVSEKEISTSSEDVKTSLARGSG